MRSDTIAHSFLLGILICCGFAITAQTKITFADDPNARSTDLAPHVKQFVTSYCVGCHGPEKQEGDFRIDTLTVSRHAADAENWQLVLDNILLGEMPPEKAKQPELPEVEQFTHWIRSELKRAAAQLNSTGDEAVLRRLNRTEYRNTIADLFDVHGDFTSGFPEDTLAHGFDTNGGALMLSAAQIQEYVKAAEFVLARAIAPDKMPETKLVTFTLHDLNREARDSAYKQLKTRLEKFGNLTSREQLNTRDREAEAKANPHSFGYRFPVLENGVLRLPHPTDGPHLDAVMTVQQYFSGEPQTNKWFSIRQPGWYRVTAEAYALKNENQPVRLKFTAGKPVKGVLPKAVSVFEISSAPSKVQALYYLEPGDRIEFTMADGAPHKQGRDFIDQPGPFLAIRSFSMEGPVFDDWPPKGHRTLFGNIDTRRLTPEVVKAIVTHFAPRLFRRPVTPEMVARYCSLFESFKSTMPAEDALRSMLAAMLVSPHFLYLEEPPNQPDGFSIAARMSYFLWRSTPDQELLQAASDSTLLTAEGRRTQAQRMIADQRTERFLRDFTGQWLGVRGVGEMRANADLYPEYDLELEDAMLAETEHFMEEMFRGDLPLNQLIDSDWTMLNERLAKHYDIDGVQGREIRRVNLDKSQTMRGGLITQASIHAVTSNGSTTSPIARGVWLLEKFLGTPPPPPPPDVPAIEPDIRGATSIKEQLDKHRQVATCNSCHQKIDPPGFALENFDVIGGWRENYRVLAESSGKGRVKWTDGPVVQVAGEWPGMGRFENFVEFREILKQQERLVIENLTHQLTTFALGREPSFAERIQLAEIASRARQQQSGLKTLLLDLIASPVFVNP